MIQVDKKEVLPEGAKYNPHKELHFMVVDLDTLLVIGCSESCNISFGLNPKEFSSHGSRISAVKVIADLNQLIDLSTESQFASHSITRVMGEAP